MADYPDWVLKHKTKGTYVNKVGDTYYLYKAHSERIKGTGKVKRVFDGYIGRITQKDGLIPTSSGKKALDAVSVYEFGLSHAVISKTPTILMGLKRSLPKNGSLAYVCAVLSFVYGIYSEELYALSHMSIAFPHMDFSKISPSVISAIERGSRMIADKMTSIFGDDLSALRVYMSNVWLLKAGENDTRIAGVGPTALSLAKKYDIEIDRL